MSTSVATASADSSLDFSASTGAHKAGTMNFGDIGSVGPVLISRVKGEKAIVAAAFGPNEYIKSVVITGFDFHDWTARKFVQLNGLLKVIGTSAANMPDGEGVQLPHLERVSRPAKDRAVSQDKATSTIVPDPEPVAPERVTDEKSTLDNEVLDHVLAS